MRIRHKIFLGYVALISAAVVLVIFFLVTLSDVNRRYTELINRDQGLLLRAESLRSGVNRQVAAARTFEQLGDISFYMEYTAAISEQLKVLDTISPLLTDETDRQAVEDIRLTIEKYDELSRETMALSQRNPDPVELSQKRFAGDTVRLALVNATESFIVKKNLQVTAAKEALRMHVEEVSTQLLLWSVLMAIAAIVAATLLTESFTAPLRRLMRNIQGISQGDLQTAVAVGSKDEIGELASVLEMMRRRLAGAASENEGLLANAHEEAEKLAKTQNDLQEANSELQEALVVESEARRRIEEIDRLKSEFASMISHELKTPVSYVFNYAGALKEHNESLNEGQRKEFLTAIQSEAQHLLTLIEDIMTISLLESVGLKHRFVETDLRKLTTAVVKDHQLTTSRHSITVKGPEKLAVRADPTRFKQVLNNLLSNAIKYSPQGGPIEVRLRANQADNTALIYVRDNGIGIAPSDVPKLFDRFTRIQRKETMAIPGSGLGLYIAHHIVEAHGGKLSLQPAPGKGTIAEVTIPMLVEKEREAIVQSAAQDEAHDEAAIVEAVVAPKTNVNNGIVGSLTSTTELAVSGKQVEKELVG